MESSSLRGGRYAVQGLLGEGAQGVTLDAVDHERQRPVAIKRFDVRGAKSWKDVELAERETRVLATIDHPLVPRYVEHFEEDGALYLVMDKVEGETLDAILRRGPMPEQEVRRFLACADRVFSYLHGRGSPVIHRDVKPRNVLRRPDGSYVFVDFGAVSELLARRGGSTIVGTLGYMAPEQLQGRALPTTDVYAVGATAAAALTGADPETLPHRGLRVDVRAALSGRASESMITCLEAMLEPDPDHRAASIGSALEAHEARVSSNGATPGARGSGFAGSGSASGFPGPGIPGSGFPGELPIGATPIHVHDREKEDAIVRSLRKLLWVLWGLGWVIVPVAMKAFGFAHSFMPLIMFGSLAALLVVNWHKGALLRAALRTLATTSLVAQTPETVRQRVVDVPSRRVRVRTSDPLREEEAIGATEVDRSSFGEEARKRARS